MITIESRVPYIKVIDVSDDMFLARRPWPEMTAIYYSLIPCQIIFCWVTPSVGEIEYKTRMTMADVDPKDNPWAICFGDTIKFFPVILYDIDSEVPIQFKYKFHKH